MSIELSFEVTKKLIEIFSSSRFIDENNYADIINDMQDIFYYFKNETENKKVGYEEIKF